MRNLELKHLYHHERYEWLKSKGICVNCAKEDAIVGNTLCPDCWERKDNIRISNATAYRDKHLEYSRNLRATRINLNQCVDCGEGLGERKATRCEKCAKRHRKRTKPYAMTRDEALYRGLCVICKKNPLIDNKTICRECLERGQAQIKLMNRRKGEKRNAKV